jgi:GNAT superfamily N-acetyltransferase
MPGPAVELDGAGMGFTIREALASEIGLLDAIDDDASLLYVEHGVRFELGSGHVFALAELERWSRSAELGRAFLAVDGSGMGLGFAALDLVDGEPYLDQLSVRRRAMRRGIGGSLLARCADWARGAGGSAIWLTTYGHVPFNRPYYERHGYAVVPETAWGSGIAHHIDEQRRYLPAPTQLVAMRRLF